MTARNEDPNFLVWLRELQTRVDNLEASEGIKQNNIRLDDWLVTVDDDGCIVADHLKWGTHKVVCGGAVDCCDDTVTVHSTAGGLGPLGMAVTPLFVWVADAVSNNVTRIDPVSGGASLTTSWTGTNPDGLFYDGVNILALNFSSGNISVINTTFGIQFSSITVPGSAGMFNMTSAAVPYGALYISSFNNDSIVALSSSTYATLGVSSISSYGTGPDGICYDAATDTLWVACATSSTVVRIKVGLGAYSSIPVIGNPKSVCLVGGEVWAGGFSSNVLTRINTITSATDVITLPDGHTATDGMFYDGQFLWTADAEGISRIDPVTATGIGYPSATLTDRAYGIVRSGDFVYWSNFGSNSVSRMKVCP